MKCKHFGIESDEMKALGRRAASSKHWHWIPGMLSTAGDRVLCVIDGELVIDNIDLTDFERVPCSLARINWAPDLTDAATRGCIVHLLQEANGPTVFLAMMENRWYVGEYCQINMADRAITQLFATEAEALVAALEAAP
jgi:hypothetical protein